MWFIRTRLFDGAGEPRDNQSFRVEDGRITALCADGDRPVPADGEVVHDLAGATVLPGLLDVHTHPAFLSSLVDSVMVLPPAVGSIIGLIETMRSHPRLGQGEDVWIEGFGFDESAYPEGRQPNRHDLDQISTIQPVFVRRCDGHSAVCNTRALELAGITAQTPDPPGAAHGRDENGHPDGRLIEVAATDSVHGLIPDADKAERIRRVARLSEHFAQRGIVGVGDLLATMIPDPLATFRAAEQLAPLPQVGLYYGWDHIKGEPPRLSDADRTGRIRIAGVKLFMDGSYSNRTAWNHDSYPGSRDHGMRTVSDDELRAACDWARENGVQVAVHAMGDAALDHVINMFADDEPWLGETPSIRLDHSTLFSQERIDRINAARMSFAVVSHTIFFFAEYGAYEHNLSPAQFEIAYPIRSFYEGVPATALSSDTPATAWSDADDVFVSLKTAVVRRSHTGADIGQDQAVTVTQGLELYTSRAASTMALDGLGRIAEGAEASFVVLDKDVFTIEPDDLDTVGIAQTWLAGQRIHPSPSADSPHDQRQTR